MRLHECRYIYKKVSPGTIIDQPPERLTLDAEWNFPLLSIGPNHFRFNGCWVLVFIFIQIFDKAFSKQTVNTLIRRRVLRCLIWVSIIYISPIKRTLGLNGLMPKLLKAS